jgi:hypothetical protein
MAHGRGSKAHRPPAPAAPRGKTSRIWKERATAAGIAERPRDEAARHHRGWSWVERIGKRMLRWWRDK